MSGLSNFLAQNALKSENVKYAASRRFVDEYAQAVEWEICAISSSEDEALRKECTKRVQIPGKKNQYAPETDYNLYLGKLAAKCTVFPNLNDVDLQNSYGVMGADAVLKAMLLPGEYAEYLLRVQEVNGFELDNEESLKEAAKN